MSLNFRSEEILAPFPKPKSSSYICDLPVSVGLFALPSSPVNLFIDEFRHLLVKAAVPAVCRFDFPCQTQVISFLSR
jgi:hypothetical protein